MEQIINKPNIHNETRLTTPYALLQEFPLSELAKYTIEQFRITTRNIIHGKDKRLLVVVGPCSIHDTKAALEYAIRLKQIADQFRNELFIVMRTYFEKPRTTFGWRGLIHDPFLDNSFDINQGLRIARKLLLDLTLLGIPTATEFLDPIICPYISDLITWCAIGARTATSQIHRELASNLSMPVGFKNSLDGNIKIAVDAVKVAAESHHIISINQHGLPNLIRSSGNKDCHIVLRGSQQGSNYQKESLYLTQELLQQSNVNPRFMIDCSHGNSDKNYRKQIEVISAITNYFEDFPICGFMLESNLIGGKQLLSNTLRYGQSITDECLGWEETVLLLENLRDYISLIQ